jgi:alkylation response protein AidB-like acyl-CoA dehydrogenase
MAIRWSDEHKRLRAEFSGWYDALSGAVSAGSFDDAWGLAGKSGLLRLPFSAEHGGRGLDLLSTMFVLEGLGYGCRDAGLSFSLVTQIVSAGIPLQRYGSAQLRARYLPEIAAGSLITAHAITDPAGGSDVFGMLMRAERDGDDWVLDGSKAFITNGPVASLYVVYAVTAPCLGPFGLTAFAVERGTPGLRVGQELGKMGLDSSPMCDLSFERCRVPDANIIGGQGRGFLVLSHVMAWEVLCSFIVTVGEMQHRFERCVSFARERRQFGQSIGSFQSVANQIVDMRIGTETARRWLYDTAEALTAGTDVAADLAIAKLVTSEANVASALHAIQIFGGQGYLTSTGIEQGLRDAVAGTIYSGSSEIQRVRIAKLLGLGADQRANQKILAAK